MSFIKGLIGLISSSEERVARLDPSTNAIISIPHWDNAINEGASYFLRRSYYISSSGTLDLLLITPDSDVEIHLIPDIEGVTSAFNIKQYGGTTVSSNGTDLASDVGNTNGRVASTTVLGLYKDPTVSSLGTLVREANFGEAGGWSSSGVGGSASAKRNFVLARNSKFLLRIENDSSAQYFNVNLNWIEHTSID